MEFARVRGKLSWWLSVVKKEKRKKIVGIVG